MIRTVREILAECKGGREVMSLRDFTLCIKTIHAHLNLACFSPDGSRESKRHLKMADDICLAVEDCFADKNSNLVNWFRREPCEFSPQNSVQTYKRQTDRLPSVRVH